MNSQINQNNLIAGALAGIATAALIVFIHFFQAAPLLILIISLFFTVPVFVVAFGWGTFASLTAVIIATIAVSLATNPVTGIIVLVLFLGPSCYFSWLLGLAKYDETTGHTEWYPLASVVTRMAFVFSAIGIIAGLFLLNYAGTPNIAKLIANDIAAQMRSMNVWREADILSQHDYIVRAFAALVGTSIAFIGLMINLSGMAFSLFFTQKIGKIRRPIDDWAASLRLPLNVAIIFVVAFTFSFLPFSPLSNLLVSVISSTFSLILSLAGITWLHLVTRNKPHRGIILTVFYAGLCSIIFSAIVAIAALIMGIWATLQPYQQTNKS